MSFIMDISSAYFCTLCLPPTQICDGMYYKFTLLNITPVVSVPSNVGTHHSFENVHPFLQGILFKKMTPFHSKTG